MGRPTSRQVFCSFGPQFGNNAPTSDHGQPNTLQRIREKCAAYGCPRHLLVVVSLLVGMLAACQETGTVSAASDPPEAPSLACGESGFLVTTLYGAIALDLDWGPNDLACEGMRRPDAKGARLRFAGSTEEREIAFIIALPDLEPGETAAELPSNVTLIEEGNSRFFSTADLNNCWTDITTLEALDGGESRFAIGGILYCVQPLAEINGSSSVSLSEIRFRGLLDWSAT